MFGEFKDTLTANLNDLRKQGLFKEERVIVSPQGAEVEVASGVEVINMCANNYLGLGNHPRSIAAAKGALDRSGFGMSWVRFICGTQDQHKKLESMISHFLETEDTILFSLLL